MEGRDNKDEGLQTSELEFKTIDYHSVLLILLSLSFCTWHPKYNFWVQYGAYGGVIKSNSWKRWGKNKKAEKRKQRTHQWHPWKKWFSLVVKVGGCSYAVWFFFNMAISMVQFSLRYNTILRVFQAIFRNYRKFVFGTSFLLLR